MTIINSKAIHRIVLIDTVAKATKECEALSYSIQNQKPFISLALVNCNKPPYWDDLNKEILTINAGRGKIEKADYKYIPLLKSQEYRDNENLARYFDSLSCTRKVLGNTIILKNTDFWEVLRALTLDLKESSLPDLDMTMIKLTNYISTHLVSKSYYLTLTSYPGESTYEGDFLNEN